MASRKLHSCKKILFALMLLFAGLGMQGQTGTVQAQETVHITITGVPGVLPSPFISDLEDDIVSGRYQVQFTYIPSGMDMSASLVEVVFVARLYHNRELLVDERSLPAVFDPGTHILSPVFDRIDFESSLEDVLSGVRSSLQRQIIQTGALPEGDYRLELDVDVLSGQRVNIIPGVAFFSVTYPPPPQLITPGNRTNVVMGTPVFSWSPVFTRTATSLEYEFLLVQVFDGQSPEDAIDANRPHHEQSLLDVTSLVYTPDLFPLESGLTYAWMVRAFGAVDDIPIRNDGESEVFTFTFDDSAVKPEDIANLLQIPLVPGLARVINLEDLEVDDAGMFYELNGPAVVEFTMDYLDAPLLARAHLNGLLIQKTGLQNPVVAGGQVSVSVDRIGPELLGEGHWVVLRDLEYRFGVGISGTADLQHESFGSLSATGDIHLTHSGIQGTLRAEGVDLLRIEYDLITVSVNRIVAHLPDRAVYADASVELMGMRSPCDITGLDLSQDLITSGWTCDQLSPINLGGDSELLVFMLDRTTGSVTIHQEDMSMDYSVTMRGDIRFDFSSGQAFGDTMEPCGIRVRGSFGSDSDPDFTLIRNTCTIPEPMLDLGFVRLGLHNLELESLSYDPRSRRWDFAIPFEASVYFPLFDDWSFEHTQPFRLTRTGIDVPEFALDANLPVFDHDAIRMELESLILNRFTFPWFEWDPTDPGPWNMEFEAEAAISESAGLPSCLRNAVMRIDNGRVTNGSLSADLRMVPLSDCRIPIVAGHDIVISSIGGSVASLYQPDPVQPFTATADFYMQSRYEPGSPLLCQDDAASQQATAELSFSSGKMVGTLAMDDTGCRIPIGMMEAELNRTSLNLFVEDGRQQAHLASEATLMLSQADAVQGNFVFDIRQRKFLELDFAITRPFRWDIPSDQEPVLTFLVNQASLSLDGLFVDGRQQVEVSGHRFGVTFDRVLVDLYEWNIRSGEIYFDEHFAFAVSLDEGLSSPKFTAVRLAEDQEQIPLPTYGLYMELGADVVVDSLGIRTAGTASATVAIGDFSYEDLSITFTDDFALQFKPFGVANGRMDFYYRDSRVAYFDAAGFTPLVSGFANEILPDKLPLPSLNVAYLLLRDANGDLVIDFDEPEPGIIALSTRPGTPLQLVMPILDPQNPPVIGGVQFEDFSITATPGNFKVETGQAWVILPEDDVISGLLEQLGIPFDLSEIRYGYTELLSDAGDYLQLAGQLKLFEHTVAADDNMLLKISGSGLVTADFDFPHLDSSIPMLPNTDQLQLGLTSLSGSLAMPVLGGGGLTFDIDIGADLKLGSGPDSRALSSFTLKMQPGNISFSAFSSIELEDPLRVELAGFAMNLNAITSIPILEYDTVNGWNFLFALDADFEFTLPGYDPFELPMNGLQLSRSGFSIPPQEINNSTLHGYELPSFTLAGFTFQPLAMRTLEPVTFNWFEMELSPIQPYFDFEVRLPEIGNEDLQPPEGFTFTNVTYQDGFLAGSMEPFEPIGGLVIPAGPPGLNPPNLRVNKINGILGSLERAGEMIQNVEITLEGTVERIPFFEQEEAECDMDVLFALTLERGVGFRGSVENLVPCGSLDLGPVSLSAGSGTLTFAVENEQQMAVFDGTLRAALEGPQGPFTAEGSVELDLIAGRILSGQVAINSPFNLSLPVRATTPFMEFQVNNARLDRDGFMIDANGLLKAGQVDIDVVFDQLTLALPEFTIASGSAQISAGVGLQIGFVPLTASITGAGDQEPPPGEALLISSESTVILDADGLKYDGQAGAALRLGDQEFANLRTVFEEDFTFRLTSPSVKSGRALVYLDLDGPAEEPLVIFDSNGFRFGGGLMAFLPDTLGLPSKNIAYAVIRDEQGNLLLNLDDTDDGGYLLQTGAGSLPVYIPALKAADGSMPVLEAQFNLITDALFVPRGGSLSVTTSLDLEPWLGAPVSIDSIGVSADGDLLLTTRLSVTLPEVFGGQKATALTTIGPDGFEEAIITAGTYVATYDPALEHLIQRDIMAMLSGDDQQSEFIVGLYGARVTFNSPAALQLAGSVSTNLFQQEQDQNFGLFFTVEHGPTGWDFNVETQGTVPEVKLGRALLTFDEHDPFDFEITNDEFLVTVNGTVSFEEMIGEALSFSVADLQFGARNLQTTPQLVLQLGAATANLPDQTFDFFSGAITGNIINPAITFSGRTFSASVQSGNLTFLDKNMGYQGLFVDTQGNFSIGSVEVDDIQILREYLVLRSLGFSLDDATGLGVSGTLGFTIPDPVDVSGELFLEGGRDAQKQAWFTTRFNLDSGFDPEDEHTVNLGSSIAVTLTDQLIEIDPFHLERTEIAVAARVTIFGEDRVFFGEAGKLRENPGISVRPDRDPVVRYNATGNVAFSFQHSFFEIDIAGDVVSSNEEAFVITLNGQAGIDLTGVSGKVGFGGMTITKDGLVDVGNFTGEAKFDLFDIFTLEMGPFLRKSDANGFMIPISDGFGAGPEDLRGGDQVAVQEIEVVEFLCFGTCSEYQPNGGAGSTGGGSNDGPALFLSLGGANNTGNGSFSGGVQEIQFYRTKGGDIRFFMDRFQVGLGDMFQASASLLYENVGGAQSLLAVGTGSFDVAGVTAGAMLAGSFSNRNDELSFGVFAGVRADVVRFEIIPGILAISGFGGGFFYKPQTSHLEVVLAAVDDFRSAPPQGIERVGPTLPSAGSITFAVMLLTEMDLVGAGNINVLSGSMFMQITNQSFYIDADGFIMGLDGNLPPGMIAGGGIAAQIGRDPERPEAFSLRVNLQASLNMPMMVVNTIYPPGIEFFMTRSEGEVLWGVMGKVGMELYGGLINGQSDFYITKDGFLFQVALWASLDPPIITVEGNVEGSVWYLAYDGAQMPLGAYVGGSAQVSALITVSAELQAAFVRRSSGRYELFGMGEGCVGGGLLEGCLAGWFQLQTDPFKLDGGLNPGDRSQLFEDARAQQEEFVDMVNQVMNNLQTEMDRPVPPGVSLDLELVATAGHNLMMTSDSQRDIWNHYMVQNEESAGNSAPEVLKQIPAMEKMQQVAQFFGAIFGTDTGYRNDGMLLANQTTSWEQAKTKAEALLSGVEDVTESTIDRLNQAIIKAIEYETFAAEAYASFTSVMTSSPVTRISLPDVMNENQLPEFEIDSEKAESQSQAIENLAEAMEALESQVYAVVDSIEHNLREMNRLLGTRVHYTEAARRARLDFDSGTVTEDFGDIQITIEPSVQAVSQMQADAMEAIDRYYGLLANRYWHKVNAAGMLRARFLDPVVQQDLNAAVSTLYGRLQTAFNNRSSNSQRFEQERTMAATRVWFIEALAQDGDNITHAGTGFSGFPQAQAAYNDLGSAQSTDLSLYEENIRDLWINMRTEGNRRFMIEQARFIVNDLSNSYNAFRQDLTNVMAVQTGLIEDFYDLKASMLANLYHIIDNYVEVKMQVDTEGESEILGDYRNRRQEILQLLEPPVITKVTVDADYPSPHFYGMAEISWEAFHPVGIAESSIHILQYETGTGLDVGAGQYVSIGKRDSYQYTAFKNNYDLSDILSDADYLNSLSVNVGVRLRSVGGAVASRRALFAMQVGRGGVSSTPGQNLLPATAPPPEDLYVHLERFYNYTVDQVANVREYEGTMFFDIQGEEMTFWTGEPDFLRVRLLARSPQANIQRFEYAVGSSPGGQDVVGWTDLVGARTNLIGQDNFYTEAVTGNTRVLNLIPGQQYYLSARAYNTAGQYQQVIRDNPVVYDDTPPSTPGLPDGALLTEQLKLGAQQFNEMWGIGDLGTTLLIEPRPFATYVPNYDLTPAQQESRMHDTDQVPSLGTIGWSPSVDEESGLWRYEYVVATSPEVTDLDYETSGFATMDTQVQITSGAGTHSGLAFDFTDQLYVHIRAVNSARLGSGTYRVGPHYPTDATPPSEPVAYGKFDAALLKVYLTERSYDPESGILGHQYSIGTEPGSTDVVDWPGPDEMDFSDMSIVPQYTPAPFFLVATEDLPWRTQLYINVRGINGQGRLSSVTSTGPFVLDFGRPLDPEISLIDRVGGNLDVKIDGLTYEDLLALDRLEVRVLYDDGTTTTPLHDWQDIGDTYTGGKTGITGTYQIDSDIDMDNIRVDVRLTNHAGLETTATESFTSGSYSKLGSTTSFYDSKTSLDGSTKLLDGSTTLLNGSTSLIDGTTIQLDGTQTTIDDPTQSTTHGFFIPRL